MQQFLDLNPDIAHFHEHHLELFNRAKGSSGNHQWWTGGYRDHIQQCLDIARKLYDTFNFSFPLNSALRVLYFHDLEKLFKYGDGTIINKWTVFVEGLPNIYGIRFTPEELNALKYIHGEGEDYSKEKRVMGELAAFCHCCDVLSARCFYGSQTLNE